jgi:hypothetical protein
MFGQKLDFQRSILLHKRVDMMCILHWAYCHTFEQISKLPLDSLLLNSST